MPSGTGARLRAFREKEKKLSLREAATEMGVSHPALRAWEAGKTPEPAYRDLIEAWTGGAVKASDWPPTKSEARIAKRVARIEAGAKSRPPVPSSPAAE